MRRRRRRRRRGRMMMMTMTQKKGGGGGAEQEEEKEKEDDGNDDDGVISLFRAQMMMEFLGGEAGLQALLDEKVRGWRQYVVFVVIILLLITVIIISIVVIIIIILIIDNTHSTDVGNNHRFCPTQVKREGRNHAHMLWPLSCCGDRVVWYFGNGAFTENCRIGGMVMRMMVMMMMMRRRRRRKMRRRMMMILVVVVVVVVVIMMMRVVVVIRRMMIPMMMSYSAGIWSYVILRLFCALLSLITGVSCTKVSARDRFRKTFCGHVPEA
jgi:hypothetical protein